MFKRAIDTSIKGEIKYIPILDPLAKEIDKFELLKNSDKASQDFLRKYLKLVRTEMPVYLVEQLMQTCLNEAPLYWEASEDEITFDDFVQFMTHGCSIAAFEKHIFKIAKNDKMSSCAWGAMKEMALNISLSEFKTSKLQVKILRAEIAGYYVGIQFLNKG